MSRLGLASRLASGKHDAQHRPLRRWLLRLESFVAARPALLIGLLIALYTALFTLLNIYRMQALRQGFDFLVYEQPIWNTVHGRPLAQSMYSFAPTHLGVDLVLFELWLAPFYALWQSPKLLFLAISLGAGLAAWPLFLIARERCQSALAGVAWAGLYLLFLPVGTITVDEFQPRLFAATALLWAYWFYRRERLIAFWICLLVAITVRSDVGLVVGCFGLYGISERRRPAFGLAPALFGFAYWAAAVFVIVPALANGHGFLWQVNYRWLGDDTRGILTRIVTDPLYTARGIATLEKGRYLAQLLWPLGFLPLLRPRLLLIPLPILALNLLSGEIVQFDIFHQYQALILPFLFLAAIEGLGDLLDRPLAEQRWRPAVLAIAAVIALVLLLPVWPGNDNSRNGLHPALIAIAWLVLLAIAITPGALLAAARAGTGGASPSWALVGPLVLLAGLMLLQHLALGSEILRFARDSRPSPRLAPAQALIARVPPAAPLAVTSQLGIHVPLREQLYFFPGNLSYDPALVERASYILADRRRDNGQEEAAITALLRGGQWRIIAEEAGFVLLVRGGP